MSIEFLRHAAIVAASLFVLAVTVYAVLRRDSRFRYISALLMLAVALAAGLWGALSYVLLAVLCLDLAVRCVCKKF